MIVKNPTLAANKINRFIPRWTADGTKVVDAVLIAAQATAKLPGVLMMTSSGYAYQSFGDYTASTGTAKFAISLQTGAAGDVIQAAVGGYVKDVSLSGTGTVTTCYSTFSVGGVIVVNATGHLTQIAASWVEAYWSQTTAGVVGNSAIGIALSSGDTGVVCDLWVVEKPHIYILAT
jgi:hypothetical protein